MALELKRDEIEKWEVAEVKVSIGYVFGDGEASHFEGTLPCMFWYLP